MTNSPRTVDREPLEVDVVVVDDDYTLGRISADDHRCGTLDGDRLVGGSVTVAPDVFVILRFRKHVM